VDLLPAVDIRGGRVTHVRTGGAAATSVYGEDPADAVARLAAAGAGASIPTAMRAAFDSVRARLSRELEPTHPAAAASVD